MKLSAMTYSFAQQQHPALPIEYPELIAKAGVHGINWVTLYDLPPEKVRKATADAGLQISCYTFAITALHQGKSESEYLAQAEQSFKNAAAVGAPRVMVVPMPIPGSADRNESRAKWMPILKKLVPMAKKSDTILTIESFQGATSPFVLASDLLEAAAEVPELRFTYDAGNAATGEDPLYTLEKIADKIEFVHIKDWLVSDTQVPGSTPGLTGKFYLPALPGEGVLPIPEILKHLRESGYEGFVDIEYEGKEAAEKVVDKVARSLRKYQEHYFD